VTHDLHEAAGERARRGEPFVRATVVWRRAPSSGQQGSGALIGPDGTVEGFLGGACAEPSVVREALRALEDGAPRLMFLGPEAELDARRREGVVCVPIACGSEGALEVYLEPVLPRPHLVVAGGSPAVEALAAMARALGWRAQVYDGPDLAEAGAGPGSMVVVASQGRYDEAALESALATEAAYVGLVASRRRADDVLGYLRQRGASEQDLFRVHAPAGLDLGPIAHREIAVAILADLVRLRAAGALGAGPASQARESALDPVCGMSVEVVGARHRLERDGRSWYFCSAGCMAAFEADPGRVRAGA
jgi:xanthine dehydrogenase accessory factor